MYETIFVDGKNLADYCTCITSIDGLYSFGVPRGENLVYPGVDGETWIDKPFATGQIELGLVLRGATTPEFNTMLRSLRMVIAPGRQLTLLRRMSFSGGNETHTARGEFGGGLTPTLQFARFGRVTVSLRVLDGLWYAQSATTVSVTPGTPFTVTGETRTQRMTIDMPAGSTITNTTNGHTLSNSATGGTVTVDVETMTATQGGTDVSSTLSWNKRYPMRLEPGPNTFSGDAFTVSYTAAYL